MSCSLRHTIQFQPWYWRHSAHEQRYARIPSLFQRHVARTEATSLRYTVSLGSRYRPVSFVFPSISSRDNHATATYKSRRVNCSRSNTTARNLCSSITIIHGVTNATQLRAYVVRLPSRKLGDAWHGWFR